MTDEKSVEGSKDGFSSTEYIAPYLGLSVARYCAERSAEQGKPVIYWICLAIVALSGLSAVARIWRMWKAHKRARQSWWVRIIGGLLGLVLLYSVYRVLNALPDVF